MTSKSTKIVHRGVCSVNLPKELKKFLTDWKINRTVLSHHLPRPMKRQTFDNKCNNHNGTAFTEDEYKDLLIVLRKLATDLDACLTVTSNNLKPNT